MCVLFLLTCLYVSEQEAKCRAGNKAQRKAGLYTWQVRERLAGRRERMGGQSERGRLKTTEESDPLLPSSDVMDGLCLGEE